MNEFRAIFRLCACICLALAIAGCKQELYQGLSEREANEMVAVLLDSGVAAERSKKERDGFAVHVAPEDFARAVKALSTAGLPRETFKTIDDVFPGGKLIMSPAEHRARLAFALSQELSSSVSKMPGVAWSRVHIALAVYDIRGHTVSPSTASVVIRYRDGADIAEVSAQARAVVTNAVEGLEAAQVRVVMSPEPALHVQAETRG